MNDWQSWAAAGVVIITIVIFLARILRKKPGKGGCDSCSCGKDRG